MGSRTSPAPVEAPPANGHRDSSLALLAAIVDSCDDAILSKSLDGRILSWNAAAERLYGYASEEALGRHVSLIVPPDRLAELGEMMESIRRGEPVEHLETVRRRRDGVRIGVSLTVSPVRDASGRVIAASAIARDITERRRAEFALGAYEAALEQTCAVLEKAEQLCKIGTWMLELDADEPWLFWSRNCYRLLGLDESIEIDVEKFFSFVHPDDRTRIRSVMQRAIAQHHRYEVDHRMVRPDGSVLDVHVWADPEYDSLGRPIRVVGVAQDVSRD
jgi:PAS domain S-box-containing protein